MRPTERNIDEVLDRYLPSASKAEMEADGPRVLHRLRSGTARPLEARPLEERTLASRPVPFFGWRRLAMVSVAAGVLLAVFTGTSMVRRHGSAFAVVERVDGSLYRVDGQAQAIHVGEILEIGETVRSNGEAGALLLLADGSRVEMRSQSELSLERAADGVRIRLSTGGVIVSAAKQRSGHLYVQTRDVTVSVVGTVFLVNAEATGSRVAVIQGEVQVDQGATSQKLLPGEQVATNPSMESQSVKEELSWSANAQAHLALLERSMAPRDERSQAAGSPPRDPTEAREAFEVATLKPGSPGVTGSSIGGPASSAAALQTSPPCGMLLPPPTGPGRFSVQNATLHGIITLAYGTDCLVLSGGPDWTRSDRFDIEALMPEGSPHYTTRQIQEGDAPELQMMIRTLLADRFKLALHREMKGMRAYNLVVVTEGKNLKVSEDQNPPDGAPLPRLLQRRCPCPPSLVGAAFSMSRLANTLAETAGRHVIDRTNLKGLFDFRVDYLVDQSAADPINAHRVALFTAMEEQLGLKLESTRSPVETLVIDHAERPAEN